MYELLCTLLDLINYFLVFKFMQKEYNTIHRVSIRHYSMGYNDSFVAHYQSLQEQTVDLPRLVS